MQEVVYIKGPLHPDLFGGETPIMVPIKGGGVRGCRDLDGKGVSPADCGSVRA